MKFADVVGTALVLAVGTALAWQWLIRGSGQAEVQIVKVPVPVECTEPVPTRPTMPTEALRQQAHVDVDQFVQSALAELARREGYELRLLTALNNCRLPVAPVVMQP
jgi:hypothetical protein